VDNGPIRALARRFELAGSCERSQFMRDGGVACARSGKSRCGPIGPRHLTADFSGFVAENVPVAPTTVATAIGVPRFAQNPFWASVWPG